MFTKSNTRRRLDQSGISLVEVVIFIVVISVGVAGLLITMNATVANSADPMLRKQSLAIAESLLEEIELQPFTYCDPDDPKNLVDPPPASAADCTGGAGGANDQSVVFGTASGESRGSLTNPFDNVIDYSGYAMISGIRSVDDVSTVVAGLENYEASVAITQAGATFSLPASDALFITVTVKDPNSNVTILSGYRFRYAPVATP